MIRLRPIAALLFSAAVFSASAAPSAPLDFADARALLHERSDILQADSAEIARAEAEAEAAKSLSGPKIEADVKQIWGTKTLDLGMETGLGSMAGPLLQSPSTAPLGMVLGKLDHISIHEKIDIGGPRAAINATMPIYTGGLITAQQEALRYKAGETRADRDIRETRLDAELAAKYWGAKLARSVEALRGSVLKDQEEEVRRARRFEKKGLISKIERMAVEVARDKAKREFVSSQTDTRVADTQLMKALREESLPELSSPLFVLKGDLGTLTEWQDLAKAQSPVLQKMNALRSQACEGVRAAEAGFKPKVYAFGTKNLIKHYLTIPEPDWMAGIGVTFTLWDNRDRFDKLNAANAVVTKAESARSEALNEIATAVEVAYLRVVQARDEYDLTASTVELARENLHLRQTSFAEGLSTAIDVDTARTLLTGAEIARRVAAYKFVVSWASLHAAAGAMPAFVDSLHRPDMIVLK